MFTNYSVRAGAGQRDQLSLYCDSCCCWPPRNPFPRDLRSCCRPGATCYRRSAARTTPSIGPAAERIISNVVPSLVYNTVDQPIFPTTGKRFTVSPTSPGLGGNTRFLQASVEAVAFLQQNARMSLGFRGQCEYVNTFARRRAICRSSRSCSSAASTASAASTSGPSADRLAGSPCACDCTGLLGGNKSLLFNLEQIISHRRTGPVDLVLRAGQVQPRSGRRSRKPGSQRFQDLDRRRKSGSSCRSSTCRSG